jgi:signal transduction histidine kinase
MYKLSTIFEKFYDYYLLECFKKGVRLNVDLADTSLKVASPSSIKNRLKPMVEDAMKRTGHGDSITMKAEKTKGKIEITISDTGVYLTKSEQAELLERHKYKEIVSRHGYGTSITLVVG